jgi:hypothetical protein
MSAIDCHKHEHIGFVRCPMRHRLFSLGGDTRVFDFLPVYRLLEDVTDDESFTGFAGDILIGGGSGEAGAVVFSIPDIFTVYTSSKYSDREPCITSHWSMDEAFMFGVGFEALGWSPERQPLLIWLAEHLMSFLVRTVPNRYATLVGEFPPEQDGGIFYT